MTWWTPQLWQVKGWRPDANDIPPTQNISPSLVVEDTKFGHDQRWQAAESAAKTARAELAADDVAEIAAFLALRPKARATDIAKHLVKTRGKRYGDSRLARKVSAYLKK